MLKIASHCFQGTAGRDKPPPLRKNLNPKVAAGFIPAQYHSRFQLQMVGNAHPLPSGGGFTTFCEKKISLLRDKDTKIKKIKKIRADSLRCLIRGDYGAATIKRF